MKAQFKYAFFAGLHIRGIVFAVIMVMNLAFIIPGLIGVLPQAALITGVSLSGVAIAVMMAVNIVGGISIMRRMYSAPIAYLHALTPGPRWKMLLASVITMIAMDIITMAAAIFCVVLASFNLAGVLLMAL